MDEDRKRLKQVSSPHLATTPFRSPQLTLWTLGSDEWRLYWWAPSYQHRRRVRHIEGIVQLPLFEPTTVTLAAGAEEDHIAIPEPPRLSHSGETRLTSAAQRVISVELPYLRHY